MIELQRWTGRSACALQAALRLTNEAFAAELGTAVRTIATWHQKPERVPSAEMQQALDTMLERAGDGAKSRFAVNLAAGGAPPSGTPPDGSAYCLRVAVAVVVNDSRVLVVQRRGEDGGGISWQFPAGVIKPRTSAAMVAVRETLAETGVHCAVVRELGSRLHPITNVYCDYLLCDYLAGDAHNADVIENVGVTWTATEELPRFIPVQHIFPPILQALDVSP